MMVNSDQAKTTQNECKDCAQEKLARYTPKHLIAIGIWYHIAET